MPKLKVPGVKKIPTNPFVTKSKRSADKLGKGATSRVKKFSKGKSYR